MDFERYKAWSKNARLARMEYLEGKLTSEEFLQKIDTTRELKCYETGKAKVMDEETVWQRQGANNIGFDPGGIYASGLKYGGAGMGKPFSGETVAEGSGGTSEPV